MQFLSWLQVLVFPKVKVNTYTQKKDGRDNPKNIFFGLATVKVTSEVPIVSDWNCGFLKILICIWIFCFDCNGFMYSRGYLLRMIMFLIKVLLFEILYIFYFWMHLHGRHCHIYMGLFLLRGKKIYHNQKKSFSQKVANSWKYTWSSRPELML